MVHIIQDLPSPDDKSEDAVDLAAAASPAARLNGKTVLMVNISEVLNEGLYVSGQAEQSCMVIVLL